MSARSASLGDTIANLEKAAIYPAKHFVTSRPTIERAVGLIRAELAQRLTELRASNKLLDVHTQWEWLREIGFADVDCYWTWRELALLVGRKEPRAAA